MSYGKPSLAGVAGPTHRQKLGRPQHFGAGAVRSQAPVCAWNCIASWRWAGARTLRCLSSQEPLATASRKSSVRDVGSEVKLPRLDSLLPPVPKDLKGSSPAAATTGTSHCMLRATTSEARGTDVPGGLTPGSWAPPSSELGIARKSSVLARVAQFTIFKFASLLCGYHSVAVRPRRDKRLPTACLYCCSCHRTSSATKFTGRVFLRHC